MNAHTTRTRNAIAIAFILTTSAAGLGTAHAQQAPCVVNVNSATPQQIGYLYRTGEVMTGRIVESRPLDSAKLDAVKGAGEKWLTVNGPHVAYEGETTCTGKVKGPDKVEKTPTVPATSPKG